MPQKSPCHLGKQFFVALFLELHSDEILITGLQVWKQLQQRNCLRAIVNIPGRQQKSHRPQVFSNDGMDFRVQTSACFADAA